MELGCWGKERRVGWKAPENEGRGSLSWEGWGRPAIVAGGFGTAV